MALRHQRGRDARASALKENYKNDEDWARAMAGLADLFNGAQGTAFSGWLNSLGEKADEGTSNAAAGAEAAGSEIASAPGALVDAVGTWLNNAWVNGSGWVSDQAQSLLNFISGGNWETDVEKWDREREEKERAAFNAAQAAVLAEAWAAEEAFANQSISETAQEEEPCDGGSAGTCFRPPPRLRTLGVLGRDAQGRPILPEGLTREILANATDRRTINGLREFVTGEGAERRTYARDDSRSIPGDFTVFRCTENCAANGKAGETFMITQSGLVVQRIPGPGGGSLLAFNTGATDWLGNPAPLNLNDRASFATADQEAVKAAAILNYVPAAAGSGLHGTTSLLGVRFDMRQYACCNAAGFTADSAQNGNAFSGPRGWANSGTGGTTGDVWQAMALAGAASEAQNLVVNTLSYGSNSHVGMAAMDLQSIDFGAGPQNFNSVSNAPGAVGVAQLNAFSDRLYAEIAARGGYVVTPTMMYGSPSHLKFGSLDPSSPCANELAFVCGGNPRPN